MKICTGCGKRLKEGDVFCPDCGKKTDSQSSSYDEIIEDIVHIDGRLSKAKTVGVIGGVIIFIVYLIFLIPTSLRQGVIGFFVVMIGCFIHILICYGVCRGGGYLIRRLSN